jgi:predicted CXXCH cytochrome family protein
VEEHNILENYSESIHGIGLFKNGLIVTATCNDCHGNHLVLPHTSPNSSISANKIASTCMKCHARIEQVHQKVIKSELWEKRPGAVPACSDCHSPHKIKKQDNAITISNQVCLKCHDADATHKMAGGKSVPLKFSKADLENSVHKNIECTKCHNDVSPKAKRPCETAQNVECSNCHLDVSNQYVASGHGQAYYAKKTNAPFCTDCHGTHKIVSRYDDTSPTYRGSIPELCGKCHTTNGRANLQTHLREVNAYFDYSKSVHGRGLKEKGLLVSAVCTDCHTSHNILKKRM